MPPHMVPPPGAPLPGQMNGLQRPISAPPPPPPPPMVPGSGGAPPMFPPPPYQGNMSLPTSGGSDGSAPSAPAPEANQ